MMTTYEVSDEQEDVIKFFADGTAMVHKRSMMTGIMHKARMRIFADQLIAWKQQKRLIQDVFPDLPKEDREFLMTGCTPEEWNTEFKEDDDGNQNVL
jgi:hypothetical protein